MIIKIILKFLKIFIIIIAIYFLLSYILVIFQRIAYPFELEIHEGLMIDHCIRVLQNKTLYLEPNATFIPFVYPPLYFWVGAFFMKIFGVNFWAVRTISVLSSFLAGFLIFKIVKKETKNTFFAFISLSLFFASYKFTGAWFDIARVDTFLIVLIILSIYILKYYHQLLAVIFSALFLSAALFTKQTAIFFIFASIFYLYFTYKKSFFLFSLMIFSICLGSALILNYKTEGWFWYYVFFVPFKYSVSKRTIIGFFKTDLFHLSFMFIPVLSYYFWKIKKLKLCQLSLVDLSFFISFLVSFLNRSIIGVEKNSLIPLTAFLIISFGIAIEKLQNNFNNKNEFQKLFFKTIIYFLILFQFSLFLYNPKSRITSTQNYIMGEKFMKRLQSIKGDVFIPEYGFYSTKAGKKMNVHYGALLTSICWFKPQLFNKESLPKDLLEKIEEKQYTAIILESPSYTNPLNNVIKKHYFLKETIFGEDGIYPFPNYVYRPTK